jgi:succinyl-CoA synthetase alpha subunit
MSVLVNKNSKVIVQGFTGSEGTFHATQMIEYGTNVVGGVTPGKGGQKHLDKPVFETVSDAVKTTGADVSIIFVPPAFTADECKVGIMPGFVFKKGKVGIVSKSGTLTYEAADQVVKAGMGITTAIGIGGDPIIGTTTLEAVQLFANDPETEAIVMIGEIGGDLEIQAARWIKANCKKPVIGFIAGETAPVGRTMGHAGAIVSGADESAAAKKKVMRECGIHVVDSPATIGAKVKEVLG